MNIKPINSIFGSFPFNKRNEIKFCSDGSLTIGAEIELQLIDPKTLNLSPKAEEFLKITSSAKITKEFYLSTVEIKTDKCENAHEIAKDLSDSCDLAIKVAQDIDLKLAATGCHPASRYLDCIITPSERYNELIDRNQWLTRRMTVYGLHVHLGMKSGDEAIRFNNFFLNFIPHLLALSVSSPFWQGEDTGLASCRSTTYESLPTAGKPYQVESWHEFECLYAALKKSKAINSLKDLWWDIRPSPIYGTIEIRVCDGLATLEETFALVALIHMLANWFNDNGTWLEKVYAPSMWLFRENKWRAIRHGIDANLVTSLDGELKPISDDILHWLEKLSDYEEKLGYQNYVKTIRNMIEKGSSSARQRKIYQKTNSIDDVIKFNIDEFEKRSPIWI